MVPLEPRLNLGRCARRGETGKLGGGCGGGGGSGQRPTKHNCMGPTLPMYRSAMHLMAVVRSGLVIAKKLEWATVCAVVMGVEVAGRLWGARHKKIKNRRQEELGRRDERTGC
jgi:hypothetical protein